MMNLIKIVGYARVSTKKDDQKHSFDSQVHYFTNEVVAIRQEYKNCQMVKVYADEGLTATKFLRKNFLKMIEDAGIDIDYKDNRRKKGKMRFEASKDRDPKFNRILVTNISRLARDVVIIDILRELVKKNVYVDFLENNWTTENKSHWMFIEMFFSFSEQESRDRSSKVKEGLEKTANRGRLFSVHHLYGYDYKDMELAINEDEAFVVRKIFTMYADGIGTRRISQHLTENGMLTRDNKPFSDATLRTMLKNEKYCGIFYRNKWKHGQIHIWEKRELKPRDEWIVPTDENGNIREEHTKKIPPIISQELFDKVQEVRNSKTSSITKRGINYGTSQYANMLFCAKCGSSMIKSARYKKGIISYTIYKCSKKKNYGKQACNIEDIRGEYLEQAIEDFKKEIHKIVDELKSYYLKELSKLKHAELERMDKKDSSKINDLKLELDSLNEQKKRLAHLYITGNFSEEQLNEMSDEINLKIEKVSTLYRDASMTKEELNEIINNIDAASQEVKEFKFIIPSNIEDVVELIRKITITTFDHMSDFIIFTFEIDSFDQLYEIVKNFIDEDASNKLSAKSIAVKKTS